MEDAKTTQHGFSGSVIEGSTLVCFPCVAVYVKLSTSDWNGPVAAMVFWNPVSSLPSFTPVIRFR